MTALLEYLNVLQKIIFMHETSYDLIKIIKEIMVHIVNTSLFINTITACCSVFSEIINEYSYTHIILYHMYRCRESQRCCTDNFGRAHCCSNNLSGGAIA